MLDAGGRVVQCTLHYDAERNATRVMRLKENADDYRYFPDPDLVPLVLTAEQVEAVGRSLPELAEARCQRFVEQYGLAARDARVLTESRALADFTEAVVAAGADARQAANWILRDVLRALSLLGLEIERSRLAPEALAGRTAWRHGTGMRSHRNRRDRVGAATGEGDRTKVVGPAKTPSASPGAARERRNGPRRRPR